jgi:hypothetical protein
MADQGTIGSRVLLFSPLHLTSYAASSIFRGDVYDFLTWRDRNLKRGTEQCSSWRRLLKA